MREVAQRVKPRMTEEAYEAKLVENGLDPASGREVPDPTPMEPPLGYVRQPTMVDHIRNMIRSEHLRREALAAGAESFEEADDFEVEDDFEPVSGYEMEEVFEPPVPAEPAAPVTVEGEPAASAEDASGAGEPGVDGGSSSAVRPPKPQGA